MLKYSTQPANTQEVYLRMLNEIRLACLNIKLNFEPKIVMTDFEAGAISAYKEIWEFLEMLGCLFHFGQALFKNLCDKCGLRQEYYDNEDLRLWFRRMQALAFVPLDKIESVYGNHSI